MSLAWVVRITRRKSSRSSAQLPRTCTKVLTDMDNNSRHRCSVIMVGRMETAVLVLLLIMESWGWNRGLGRRERILWLKHDMAVCLEGGTVTPDLCRYHLSKDLIYRLRASTQDTIRATLSPRPRHSRLRLLISMYSPSGEWAAWRTGSMAQAYRMSPQSHKLRRA